MDTEPAVAAPPAVAPPLEDKLVEVFELLEDVVEKFNIAFGAETVPAL